MSVTFTAAAWNTHPKLGRVLAPLFSCDCSRRWCDDCDSAWDRDENAPDMYTCEVCNSDHELNLANLNAADLLAWLGLDAADMYGHLEASELAARCRRRLWDETRNHDPAIEGEESGGPGTGQCRAIYAGRGPDYLRTTTARLLRVAESAGDNFVSWG